MPDRTLTEIFNAAGPNFDDVTPAVWGPAGSALVGAARVRPGDRVLDVCCDAVLCGFGVFFLPDMDRAVGRFLRLLRPGGVLAFSVWHGRALADFVSSFVAARARITEAPQEDPGDREPHPITRIDSAEKARGWLASLGATGITTDVLRLQIPRTDEFCWSMVLGSGLRGYLIGLEQDTVELVRREFLAELARRDVDPIDCDTLVVAGRRA